MKRKYFVIMICMLLFVTGFSGATLSEFNYFKNNKISNDIETSSHILIRNQNALGIASLLSSEGFDVLYDSIDEYSFELIVAPYELITLRQDGYDIEILARGRPFREIQAEREKASSGLIPPGYPDLSQIINELFTMETNYPSICKVYDLTDIYNMPSTHDGNHLYALKISDNVQDDEDEPSFLMVSCHHAREIITPVIALYAIQQFTDNYGSNPDITALVDEYEIWICPVWNPDGYDYVFNYDNMWRKNRQPYPPGIGVDQNRNYPFGWYSGCSGSTDPTSETYKGPAPASEVETQIMMVFTDDQHFTKVIDYHSYGEEVLYGYCCHSHPFSSFMQSEAVSISTQAGYGGDVRPPSAEGEHYQWQIAYNGSYANLMETYTTFQPAYSTALAEAAQVWPSTIWILQRAIPLSGHVTDYLTGEPLVVPITLQDITFPNGEFFYSEPGYGRYHMFLPLGTYDVEFTYEGYESQAHEVTITQTGAEVLDIYLQRYNEPPNIPTITGTENGENGVEYYYQFQATDPDEDDLEYYIEWGDNESEVWIGPYASGEEINLSHVWIEEGTYIIKAKVRDIFEEESDWGTLSVTMPLNQNQLTTYSNLLQLIKGLIGEKLNLFMLK